MDVEFSLGASTDQISHKDIKAQNDMLCQMADAIHDRGNYISGEATRAFLNQYLDADSQY